MMDDISRAFFESEAVRSVVKVTDHAYAVAVTSLGAHLDPKPWQRWITSADDTVKQCLTDAYIAANAAGAIERKAFETSVISEFDGALAAGQKPSAAAKHVIAAHPKFHGWKPVHLFDFLKAARKRAA